MNPKAPVLLAALGLLAVACPNGANLEGKERFDGNPPPCDALPIFEESCSGARCHEGKSAEQKPDGWLDLFQPDLENRLLTGDSQFADYPDLDNEGCPEPPERIVSLDPEKLDEGLMIQKLLGHPSCGEAMPPAPARPLTSEEIYCVRGWVADVVARSGLGPGGATGSGGAMGTGGDAGSGGTGTGGTLGSGGAATGGAAASGGAANTGGTGGGL